MGGGFGGKKESGQLRFGGRDRPFKKPIALELKEQDERRQRERDRRSKDDERRRRDRRRKSPVRDTRAHSQIDKKKENNKRIKSPDNANSKPTLKENLPHLNGKDHLIPKDSERSGESSRPGTNPETPKSPARDSQRTRRRSVERDRKSKDNKRRSVSKDKSTKTTKVQSPVRKLSRERRENQKAVSPVPSRGRSSKTSQPPVTPLERSSRRSPLRSHSPATSSKKSKYSHETDNLRLWSPSKNREFNNQSLERERYRSPLNMQGSVVSRNLHSHKPDSLNYIPLNRRERFPPREVRQRYPSPVLNRDFKHQDNLYRHEDISSSYHEVSPLENDQGRYEYRRQSPYRSADYMDTRDTYNDVEPHFNEYSTHRAEEYQSPLRERSIERVYTDHNGQNSYSEQSYNDYDRYRNYDDHQMRDDYDRNRRMHSEMGRRDMRWNNQNSSSSLGQVESNYQTRNERVSSEEVRNRSNILHLKKVASSFRR